MDVVKSISDVQVTSSAMGEPSSPVEPVTLNKVEVQTA
jgi:hypothetical protein